MLPALTGPDGMRNITRQNNSETSGFDRGRCVLTTSCRNTALAATWIDQMYAPIQSPQNNWGTYGEKDSFNIFEMSENAEGGQMLKHMDLGDASPVEVREAQSVNGPLAILNEYYDVYVTEPADAKWRLDNMHETYLKDMNSKYVYPNVFMSIDDTNKVSQYDTDIKKYAEQKKADWILNGGINDPNGFSVFKGKVHLFYQYHPYSRDWGPMHWGHSVTEDMIRWEQLPAALAPDQEYDREGCFSGSAIEADGKQALIYTGVTTEKLPDGKEEVRQNQ